MKGWARMAPIASTAGTEPTRRSTSLIPGACGTGSSSGRSGFTPGCCGPPLRSLTCPKPSPSRGRPCAGGQMRSAEAEEVWRPSAECRSVAAGQVRAWVKRIGGPLNLCHYIDGWVVSVGPRPFGKVCCLSDVRSINVIDRHSRITGVCWPTTGCLQRP